MKNILKSKERSDFMNIDQGFLRKEELNDINDKLHNKHVKHTLMLKWVDDEILKASINN